MKLKPVAALQFTDAQSDDDIYVGIQAAHGQIALLLSIKGTGDAEAILRLDDCKQIVEGLQQALLIAEGQ